ncbi:GNAT family N-acetyltransferase [Halobacillus litoralis]|uniref:GNAT family N-acetyltransferase n=1 Tax=Halobacillus litoralis TaxID=45668 RepID=UPI001CD716EF|nr:GNAT family N-acetyltransferase [Halobacillus litoralis]MCA0969305.1 GNAT family N-acetyltransferase [Halobacillus litoralis]
MGITLSKLRHDDAEALLAFEKENRGYFEKSVPSRGDEYFQWAAFLSKHEELLREQEQGLSKFYLIKDEQSRIVGRINLVDIDQSKRLAHLGYRVGEKHTGQGVAVRAVHQLTEIYKKSAIHKVLAKTTDHNIGSQKVLEKNGFKRSQVDDDTFVMNGERVRFISYEKYLRRNEEMMYKPKALQKGDRVAVIAPSGLPDEEEVNQGIRQLEEMGLEVVTGQHLLANDEDYAALEEKRRSDLHEAFLDTSIKAVFCAEGGFGSARLAPRIDYEMLSSNPKIFWGFSDSTYLHQAIQRKSGLVTFHGPMIAHLNDRDRKEETRDTFLPLFTGDSLTYDSTISPLRVLSQGTGEGRVVGGNLAVLTSGLGTPYQVQADGALLLLEEVAEPAFRIDLMLHHLKQAGVFDHVKGVVLGDFQAEPAEREMIHRVLESFFEGADFPVVEGFRYGHCQPHYGIPLGVPAKLTTDPPRLEVDPGVQ